MSKKNEVLAVAERLALELGALRYVELIKQELSAVWGEKEEAPATYPATDTFTVQVGVEVLSSAGASPELVEDAVREALESAASGRDEVVSISVASA